MGESNFMLELPKKGVLLQFMLMVDGFGCKVVCDGDMQHLINTLKSFTLSQLTCEGIYIEV